QQSRPPGLFGGRPRRCPPPAEGLRPARSVVPARNATRRSPRDHGIRADLGGLLHGELAAVAFRQRLHHGQPQRWLVLDPSALHVDDDGGIATTAYRRHAALRHGAGAVAEKDLLPRLEPQHRGAVVGFVAGQCQFVGRLGDVVDQEQGRCAHVTAWTAGGRTAHPTVWSRWWSAPESPRRAAEPAAAEADAAARPVSWAPRRRCGRAGRHARPTARTTATSACRGRARPARYPAACRAPA